MLALSNITPKTVPPTEFRPTAHATSPATRIGGYPFVGTPDKVASELADLSAAAGMRGIGVSFVNYLNEVPYFCDEVLPRLVRLGVRHEN